MSAFTKLQAKCLSLPVHDNSTNPNICGDFHSLKCPNCNVTRFCSVLFSIGFNYETSVLQRGSCSSHGARIQLTYDIFNCLQVYSRRPAAPFTFRWAATDSWHQHIQYHTWYKMYCTSCCWCGCRCEASVLFVGLNLPPCGLLALDFYLIYEDAHFAFMCLDVPFPKRRSVESLKRDWRSFIWKLFRTCPGGGGWCGRGVRWGAFKLVIYYRGFVRLDLVGSSTHPVWWCCEEF